MRRFHIATRATCAKLQQLVDQYTPVARRMNNQDLKKLAQNHDESPSA
jgi:hypothetical protein